MVGRTIAHYEILAKLGEGGMGVVYKARDPQLDRMVAIKVLPTDRAAKPERRLRFAQEAKAASALNHPNIVVVHHIGTEDDLDYIVMEFVDGVTLDHLIPSGGMEVPDALKYAIPIADALARAHAAGIIHRDLKPGNVIAGHDGQMKLVDFGLAKLSSLHDTRDSDLTRTAVPQTEEGSIVGTVCYMSPEQAEARTVDARSDIFSFGAVLYEMVTGQRAFMGRSNMSTLAAVLKGAPKPVAELRRGLPRDLVKIIDRCLRKDLAWRYQSAADLKVSLCELQRDLDSDTVKEAEPAGRRLVRSSLLAGLGVGLTIAVIASLAVWWVARSASTAAADRSPIRLDADLGPEAQVGATYAATRATISPDGKRLIYSARGPDGRQMLASRFLDTPSVTVIPGTESASDPFFSPDGQWIGFFADGKLKKLAFGGGAPITLATTSNPRGASWSEDGTIIAALTNTAGLYRIPTAGGSAPPQLITQLRGGEVTHRWPQIVPGGAVIFTSSTDVSDYESAAVERLDLKSGQRRVVYSGGYFGRYSDSGHLLYVHGRALYAVPMNSAGDVRGTPVLILDDVASSHTSGAGQFDVSRTGIFLYYRGKSEADTWSVAALDESGSRKILPSLSTPGGYFTPRFSPDGRRLALAIEERKGIDVYAYDLQTDALSRLTFSGKLCFTPVWTPDGKHIVYSSERRSLFWTRSDGGGQPQKLLDANALVEPYSLTPDGKRLAFQQQGTASNHDVWTLPLDTTDPDHPKPGKPEPFANTSANEIQPAFSPDGRWLAFASDESGIHEIYVRPFPPDAGGGRWQISSGGGKMPAWAAGGREAVFRESGWPDPGDKL